MNFGARFLLAMCILFALGAIICGCVGGLAFTGSQVPLSGTILTEKTACWVALAIAIFLCFGCGGAFVKVNQNN